MPGPTHQTPALVSAADRAGIEDLLFGYAELMDAGDLMAVGELFADASLTMPDGTIVAHGAAAATQLYETTTKRHADGTPRTRHLVTNVLIEQLEDATFEVRSYFTVVQHSDVVALQVIVAGRYRDRIVASDGTWRFQERCMMPELMGDVSDHLLFDPSLLDPTTHHPSESDPT